MNHAGLGTGETWREALSIAEIGAAPAADLAFVFASYHYRNDYPSLLTAIREELSPRVLVGCSGQGVISTGREAEDTPALSIMTLNLPGAELTALHLSQREVQFLHDESEWYALGGPGAPANAWVILADPFTIDPEALISGLTGSTPGGTVLGGMASSLPGGQRTHLFLDQDVHESGAVILRVAGGWTVKPVVSQGAEPIGETWTITDVDYNVIRAIGGRRALDVLVDTMRSLPASEQQRASQSLLVGLAMDEYRDTYGRGDFLIRNLVGVHQDAGALVVGALPREGQTLQFQLRDATAADEELRMMLGDAAGELDSVPVAGALLCSCNGRGAGLFGLPHHDAAAIAAQFGKLPVAGLFCNGEIGPVGDKTFVHGFTASIGLFVPAGMRPEG
ncbi:MAG: FIST signal transduction protein [Tepidiformaceae bacterium]